MMAAMMVGCAKTPLEVETKTVAGDNSSAAGYVPGKKVEDPDSLTAQKAVDLFERLAQKETFGFTPLDVYASGKTIKGSVISYLRPYGADGISNVTRYVDDVETVTVTTKLISENETENEWRGEGRDSDWHGVETMVTASYKMAYGKGAFDFTTVRTSSEAAYNDGKYEAAFPPLNWTMSEKTEASELYNTQHADSLFKAKDFISTVTYVAKVDEKFGADSAKFELTNKLTVLSYVVPDPEDQVIDTIGVGTVERRNGKLYGIGRWYARHTLIDPVLVNNQEEEFNASLTGRDGEPVYASNANFKTAGEGWRGVGSANYYDNATNSVESFNNTYAISAAKGMTMSYEGIDIVFNANMVVSENGQTIGASTLKEINGQYYNVYPYSNEVSGVYTVSVEKQTASIDLYATSSREIRVKVDEVIENLRYVKTVTEKENGFDIKVDFHVKSNIYGEYVKTLNDEIVYGYKNRSHEDVIAESAKESETKSNGKVGDLKGTYSSTLIIGNQKSDNVYDWTLNKKESVASFNGVSVKTVVDLSIAEQGSTLETSAHGTKTIGNVTYDAYAYNNSTRATLTCEGKKVTKDASTAYDVLVKHNDTVETKVESKDYSFTANVNGNTLVGTGLNTVKKAEYVNGVKKAGSEQTYTQEKIITATLTVTPTFVVADKAGLNASFAWGSFGETANEPEQTIVENDKTYKVKARNFRGYVAGKPAYLRLEEKDEVVSIDGVTLATTSVDAVKAVDMVASAVAGNNVTLTPKVNVTLSTDDGVQTKAAIGEAKTYTIESSMVGTYTPETTREYEPKVENGEAVVYVYDVTDGVKVQVRRDHFTPAYFLNAQAGTDVIAANNLFATVYNGERNSSTSSSSSSYWTVSNKKGQITSTMSNGAKSETNVADFGFDQTITYKDGDYTYTFNGSMAMYNSTDAIVAAGNKTVNGIAYEASNYQENFYGVYSIDGNVIANLSDAVKRQILVEKEAEDLVPGTIKWIAFRAVAAIPDGNGGYKNADGHMQRIKGVAVGTEEGKVCYIPFADASDSNVMLPTATQFSNANWQTASYYNESYVAGYDKAKNGVWYPATVEDRGNQILYKDDGQAVRSLTDKSMNTWGWSNHTSVVDGYTISEVKGGVVTITFNGQTRTIK
jgi:hypothetical protein